MNFKIETRIIYLIEIPKMKKTVCRTKYLKEAIEPNEALSLYTVLKESVDWEEGIRSKNGFTRKAKALDPEDYPLLLELVSKVLPRLSENPYAILGLYLNYYENGEMYTPNHSHPKSHQLVISLGAERCLNVGKKSYQMGNGDAILFGSSIHGVPKDDSKEGRISIATFMVPL